MLKQLIHNGIVIPEPPQPLGLTLRVRGRSVSLTPKQEEMAMAWARKKDTPYVRDPVFCANFMRDFSLALGIEPPLALDEVDLTPCYEVVDRERAAKEALTKEERKALAAERRAAREALKARYGYAIVNGQRVELGNYMTEPSGIFMGRGEHPLRGRWKEGAKQSDVTLNLSPDAPRPEGDWAEIVWQPESLWVARWKDPLADKLKYIWLSDTAPVKQEREAMKFDKAIDLNARLDQVRARIRRDLEHEDPRRRMLATACYLIDALCLRVGDEKDPDEADTVGATTLRPEHVTLRDDGTIAFRFLGKDSVEWNKTLNPPEVVRRNLVALIEQARPSGGEPEGSRGKPQLFPDVSSSHVNEYLSSISPGLTAKVFRTHHATMAVRESLSEAGVRAADPEYLKWKAASLANLEAAVLCNHTKQATGDWAKTKQRYQERQQRGRERVERYRQRVQELTGQLKELRREAREKVRAAPSPERREKARARYDRRIASAERRLETARAMRERAEQALGKVKAQATIAAQKRTWNLSTSLKSYIDPRVYHAWGREVDYDVLARYYPAVLQRKFAWVRATDGAGSDGGHNYLLRTCMHDDLPAVAELMAAARRTAPELDLPEDAEEIGARYLPALGHDWREAVIAIGEEQEVVAFAALGPAWERDGQELLDLMAVARPDAWDSRLARALAEELRQRVDAYRVQHPRSEPALAPRDPAWVEHAPQLAQVLGLLPDEEAEAEEDDGA